VIIDVTCESPFVIEVVVGESTEKHEVLPGRSTIEIR